MLVDYAPDGPSCDAPASFVGTKVMEGDQLLGVLVIQIPLDQITTVMSGRAGLGETGEAYLVGADQRLRSDTHRDSENVSMLASYADAESGRRVAEGSEQSRRVAGSLTAIIQAPKEASEDVSEIVQVTSQQATRVNAVSDAMRSVAGASDGNAAASEELAANAEELGAQGQFLFDLVGRFEVRRGTFGRPSVQAKLLVAFRLGATSNILNRTWASIARLAQPISDSITWPCTSVNRRAMPS